MPPQSTETLEAFRQATVEANENDSPDIALDVSGSLEKLTKTNQPDTLRNSLPSYCPPEDANGLLERISQDREVTLTFQSVNSWVPNLLFGDAKKNAKKGNSGNIPSTRQILYGVTGAALPGEVLALMGPSGSGKTSLLSLLGGRASRSITTEGDILFNGKPPGKWIKRRMGFVLQDDLLYADLTVYETLFFAALLRLPRTMSREEKRERVESVIQTLGLERCKNTIIGGFMRRGVSGGERKRVSVGHEMLINPSIIFLDEPTSGLDSTTALSLMSTLQALAAGGRAVVTTIHQPSSRIFQGIPKLMLLAEGRVLYYGSNGACVDWFGGLGSPCPFGINVADFILDLANANQGDTKEGGAEICRRQVKALERLSQSEGYDPMRGVTAGNVGAAAELLREVSGEGAEALGGPSDGREPAAPGSRLMRKLSSVGLSVRSRSSANLADTAESEREWGAPWATQFSVLLLRAMKVRRFETLSSQKVLQIVLVAVIAGMIFFQRAGESTVAGARDTVGLLFFEIIFLSFQALFGALFVFPNDMRMVVKERSSSMYRISAFYLSRVASDLPMDCLIPTMFVFIVYFMGGLRLSASAFVSNWLTVILSLLTAQSLGLILGAGVSNVKTAQTFATVLMLAFMLSGGYFVSFVPAWISWLKYISYINYAYNVLLHIEYRGREIFSCEEGPPACGPVDLQEQIGSQKDPDDPVGADVGMLVLILVVLRLGIYFVLNQKTKQKQT
mmetsp:Transcript_39200/g.92898  ORF Transcript_39200/g.92898 Transcript_39200/m.92898 type:complete len:734 (+) Transcript_39200:104-2305(+)